MFIHADTKSATAQPDFSEQTRRGVLAAGLISQFQKMFFKILPFVVPVSHSQ